MTFENDNTPCIQYPGYTWGDRCDEVVCQCFNEFTVHQQIIRQADVIDAMNNEHPKDPDWGTIYFFWGQLQKIYKGPGAANAAKWTTGETT